MTSQPGSQTIVIHILSNISRSNGNQTIKFGQLTEQNMRNIVLENFYTKYGGKTIPRHFPKKSKLSIYQDIVEGYGNIFKLTCKSHIKLLLHIKLF